MVSFLTLLVVCCLWKTNRLKFDDERVYKVSEKEAIDDNYGGEEVFSYHFHGQIQKTVHKKFANACMLFFL